MSCNFSVYCSSRLQKLIHLFGRGTQRPTKLGENYRPVLWRKRDRLFFRMQFIKPKKPGLSRLLYPKTLSYHRWEVAGAATKRKEAGAQGPGLLGVIFSAFRFVLEDEAELHAQQPLVAHLVAGVGVVAVLVVGENSGWIPKFLVNW